MGCPGSATMDLRDKETSGESGDAGPSQLTQWPIQLHLVSPMAPYFQEADVVLAADCVPFAYSNFHADYLKGSSLAIACPKLDDGTDIYIEKLTSLIDDAKINTLTVIIMQVPCCSGLTHFAKQAAEAAGRKIPIKEIIIGVQGEVISEEWV
jgi:hypothetical protein